MQTVLMIALAIAGFLVAFTARIRGGDRAGRIAFFAPLALVVLALGITALIGGAPQAVFLMLLPLWISPVILGLALGYAFSRGQGRR